MSDPQISEMNQTETTQEATQSEPIQPTDLELQQRAEVLDLAIQKMLAKHNNLYNFLVVSRQLYFIVLAGLKAQLTKEFFSEFLPDKEEPTDEELQLVLNAICQKTAYAPEYPDSVTSHYNFLTKVLLPWVRSAAEQEQRVLLQNVQTRAEQRLNKTIDLTAVLQESASLVKRKSVAYFYQPEDADLKELCSKIKTNNEEQGLVSAFVIDADTDQLDCTLSVKKAFKDRQQFTNKTVDRLFNEYMLLNPELDIPDVLVFDLRKSFVTTHTALKIVDKQLMQLAKRYSMAIIGIVDQTKLMEIGNQ